MKYIFACLKIDRIDCIFNILIIYRRKSYKSHELIDVQINLNYILFRLVIRMNNFQSISEISFARKRTRKTKQNERAVCRRARFNCKRKRIKKKREKKKKKRGNKERRKITFNQAPARGWCTETA